MKKPEILSGGEHRPVGRYDRFSKEKEGQRKRQQHADDVEQDHARSGTAPQDHPGEEQQGRHTDRLPRQLKTVTTRKPVEQGLERFGEGDRVESDADRLGQKEGDADRRADLQPERAGDDEVCTAAFDTGIGAQFGDGQSGRNGDQVAEQNDRQCPPEAQHPGSVAEAQEQDRPQDRRNGGKKNRRGAEPVLPGRYVFILHDSVSFEVKGSEFLLS